MKIIACPVCRDVFGLVGNVWRKCICGTSGGQYNEDLMTATLGGQARVFGVANLFFEPLFQYLTEEQKKKIRPKYGYGPEGDCWWGEYEGDIQIFRIKSPDGPRLLVAFKRVNDTDNLVTVVDKREFRIDGRDIKEVTVPANDAPFLRQTLKRKKR